MSANSTPPLGPTYWESAQITAKEGTKIAVSTAIGAASGSMFAAGTFVLLAAPCAGAGFVAKRRFPADSLEAAMIKVFAAFVVQPIIVGGSLYAGSQRGIKDGKNAYELLTVLFG